MEESVEELALKDRGDREAVDFAELEQMLGVGEPRLLGEVLKIWLKTFPPQMKAVHQALAFKDRSMLQEAAHAAKSAAQQAAAFRLGSLLALLEEQSSGLNWEDAERFYKRMADEEKRVRKTINNYLDRNNLRDDVE